MPALVQVPVDLTRSINSLDELLIKVLTMSIAGYQFLQPKAIVHGDARPPFSWTIRWIQGNNDLVFLG